MTAISEVLVQSPNDVLLKKWKGHLTIPTTQHISEPNEWLPQHRETGLIFLLLNSLRPHPLEIRTGDADE